ncbi:Formylglycine-generating enzyme, required for sulfatase activity, contains SUMF1/FGE domain [Auraticoccus monumenti]|uniref:Formylglycine-generating enzyme, required for sulfatase activity, contains SUMF1/FGE domain n=1 Tax=Auraticoccus monumenti TaxID=675864 RepID=A0A1G6UD79_9ACTN|nr:Formylglycine-generating enzyme, required for sulfatase activity, contains SUMF1/FGE domain [Auraticoccus monumenti]
MAGAADPSPRSPLVEVPAGSFWMGSEDPDGFPADGEGPVRQVSTRAFAIAAHAVTNADFAEFVEATAYRTDAERFGWSFVFHLLVHPRARRHVMAERVPGAPWWRAVRGATWFAPGGPGSDVARLADHPVVHVSHADALAYAGWRGARLPTEAEWERAARGGLEGAVYPWGDELTPGGEHRANIWQGRFPEDNTEADGWLGTAPVDAFAPNGWGLYGTSGNVWEWTGDLFSATYHRHDKPATRQDPRGPRYGQARVVRGGSYLCHHSYCNRYRVAARTSVTDDSSLGHTGLRVVVER